MKSNASLKTTTPLVPARSTELAAAHVLGFLRHPRSLVRINPTWAAPEVTLDAPETKHGNPSIGTVVKAYKRRVSPTAWRRITGENPPTGDLSVGHGRSLRAPELFVVTLHANVNGEPAEVDRMVRNSTSTIHSLFRLIVENAPHDVAKVAEAQQDGSRSWTWHALLTGNDIRRRSLELTSSPQHRAA